MRPRRRPIARRSGSRPRIRVRAGDRGTDDQLTAHLGTVDRQHRGDRLGPGRIAEHLGEALAEVGSDFLDFLDLPGDGAVHAPEHLRVAHAEQVGDARHVADHGDAVPIQQGPDRTRADRQVALGPGGA